MPMRAVVGQGREVVGGTIGLDGDTRRDWETDGPALEKRLKEASVALLKLRELSEKATPGELRRSSLAGLYLIAGNEPSPVCSMGEYKEDGSVDGEFENCQANEAFLIGAWNYVRSQLAALAPASEQKGKP